MPKKRPYGQYCPIAQTLDVVGDRWSILIVRELFLGPTRYGELAEALRPISTDVLAKRLRELESTGIIDRSDDGSYVLTAHGTDLAPVLKALGQTALGKVIGELGWSAVSSGVWVEQRLGLSFDGSYPFLVTDKEARVITEVLEGKGVLDGRRGVSGDLLALAP